LSTNEAGRATVIFFSRAPSATLIHPHESTVSSYCAWRKVPTCLRPRQSTVGKKS
jgi:hypothetical protein